VRGRLFDDFVVEVDPRIATRVEDGWELHIGGSWAAARLWGDVPQTASPGTLKFFYEQMLKYEHPVILDIGASTGCYPLLAKFHPGAQVYAFEPYPPAYEILLRNIELNELQGQVSTYRFALSNYDGVATLKAPVDRKNAGLACLGKPLRFMEWEEVEVSVYRLDSLSLPCIDLIKIDTEGCELLVLQGGEETINRHRPSILLEYEERNTAQFGYHRSEIADLLGSWGYCYEPMPPLDLWAWPKENQ